MRICWCLQFLFILLFRYWKIMLLHSLVLHAALTFVHAVFWFIGLQLLMIGVNLI